MKIAIDIGGDTVDRMLSAQEIRPAGRTISRIDGGSIGCLGGAPHRSNGNVLAIAGLPVPAPGHVTGHADAARLLPQCDGAFAAVFWDAADRKLVVVTDFLGLKPLYIERTPGRLRLASETKAFGRDTPDLSAWGAFLAFGHTIGDRTLVAGVERVPPATVLVYEPATDTLQSHCYWQWPADRHPVHPSDLLDALRRSVAAYAGSGPAGAVLLSGGFDSRLILYLLKDGGLTARALIVGHRDELFDADGRFAKAVAAATRTPYRYARPPADFFSTRQYLEYLAASDAATPSLYLFIAQIAQFIDDVAVWEGLVPGFALMPLHQPRGGFAAYLQQECRGRDAAIWRAAGELFRDDVVRDMYDGFQTDLWKELARYPDDGYGVSQFVIGNRSRNRTAINPFKVFSNVCQVYTPGLTRDFIALASCIPYEDKAGARFYLDLMRELCPESLTVPFLSGGKFYDGEGRRLRAALHAAIARADRFVTRHPRAARLLGLGGTKFARSTLLDGPGMNTPDPLLKFDPAARTGLSATAEKLLFHWQAWKHVHSGADWAAFLDKATP